MSNNQVGTVYQQIIADVVESSRVDFEEGGVDEQVLEELKLVSLPVLRSPSPFYILFSATLRRKRLFLMIFSFLDRMGSRGRAVEWLWCERWGMLTSFAARMRRSLADFRGWARAVYLAVHLYPPRSLLQSQPGR